MEKIQENEIEEEVMRNFKHYATHANPKFCIDHYQSLYHQYELFRKRLNSPVNKRTGEPLKNSTIKSYQYELKHFLLIDLVNEEGDFVKYYIERLLADFQEKKMTNVKIQREKRHLKLVKG